MATFAELLNQPLPSQREVEDTVIESEQTTESFEDETINDGSLDECGNSCASNASMEDGDITDDIEDVLDDDEDIEGLSDDDLAALDAELTDDVLGSVADDDEGDVSLSPEEEMQADNDMALAATTMLVKDELNAQEKAEFVKTESTTAVNESFMTSVDVALLTESTDQVVTEAKYTNRMRIELSKDAKVKQLRALAVLIAARRKGDPDYVKYKKVMRVKKVLRAKMDRKYGVVADKMAKVYFKRLKGSKSSALAKIGGKFSK